MPRRINQSCSNDGTCLPAFTLTLLLVLVLAPGRAHAYIDPGSGALIWQGLLAAFFGALFYMRRFMNFLRGRRAIKETSDAEESPSETQ